jgi:hypothetical protein
MRWHIDRIGQPARRPPAANHSDGTSTVWEPQQWHIDHGDWSVAGLVGAPANRVSQEAARGAS